MCECVLSHVQLHVTLWTVTCEAPLSVGFFQGVGCHFRLQGIFLTQGSNPRLLCLLHCRQTLYRCNSSDNKDKSHKPKADSERGKTQSTLGTHKTKGMMLSYTLLDSKL